MAWYSLLPANLTTVETWIVRFFVRSDQKQPVTSTGKRPFFAFVDKEVLLTPG
jgi:hypothetical protein